MALLDISTGGWRILHANDAFRAAGGLHLPPEQLSGFSGSGLSPFGGQAEGNGSTASLSGLPDFWSAFGHVTETARSLQRVSPAQNLACFFGYEQSLACDSSLSCVHSVCSQPPNLSST
jgi:hypothetical protein